MAVALPAASPLASVRTASLNVASTCSGPASVMLAARPALSLPICARVVFSTTATATPAPIWVPPSLLLEPFSATVVTLSAASAVTMKWPALPLSVSPLSTSAMVWLRAMLSPNEAPTPTSPPLAPPDDPLGAAVTKLSVRLCACRSTSPPDRVSWVGVVLPVAL